MGVVAQSSTVREVSKRATTMEKERKTFVFHKEWYDAIAPLDKKTRCEVYEAIMHHVWELGDISLSPLAEMAMRFIRPQIVQDTEKWMDIKIKRSSAGSKHRGNQYTTPLEQNGTNESNGTSVPTLEQNGTSWNKMEQVGTNGSVYVLYEDNNNIISMNNNKNKKEEKDINISSKKIDFQSIVDCWNKYNGQRLGKVTKLTTKRKGAIKRLMEEHSLTLEQLMRLLSTIPYADNWLYNPTREHKDWKPDFDWWMTNTKGWFTKLVEGKVHTQNQSIFQSIINGETLVSAYTPMTSLELRWNEIQNCYIFTGMFWNDIYDGYTKENRPDGARIMLNNGRGYIHWSSEFKEWLKD